MKRKSRIYFVILASILLSFTVSTSQVYANNTELQIAPDVQQSIDLLNCSPIGNPYAYLSKQEVQNAIEKGGSAATEAFFMRLVRQRQYSCQF